MNNKVLVAYASRHGSTEQIAQWIASDIQAEQVDVMDVGNVQSLRDYDFLILGTPMYDNEPLPQMKSFITNHMQELQDIDKAVWIVVADDDSDQTRHFYRDKIENYLPSPIKFSEVFSGEIDLSELTDLEKQETRGYFNKIDMPMQSYNFMYKNDFRDFSARVNLYINK